MKQVFIKSGRAVVEDVPAPMVEKGTVLVALRYSCISPGTEISGVKNSAEPLLLRALKHPEEVRQALRMAAEQGAGRIYTMVKNKIATGAVVGYSAVGTVIEVGEGVEDIRAGDCVACAGAQCAHHAEVIRVPRNLLVPVPSGVDLKSAATVTLGAIAMQGVRRCQVTLGETIVVVGLGALGLLTVQLLIASGARVIGIDLNRKRVELARELGAQASFHPDDAAMIDHVHRLSDGYGADGVIVTAASSSSAIMSEAFRMCRKKARVVLVGDVGLQLNRQDFYKKELDFLISSSYGPGRYDTGYEEGGVDYPIAYVRWTENRNLAEYLRLLRDGRIKVDPLLSRSAPVDEAESTYAALRQDDAVLLAILEYPQRVESWSKHSLAAAHPLIPTANSVRIGVIGAGSFAKGMHLPNLQSLGRLFSLRSVMSRTAHNSMSVGAQFHAAVATTSMDELLKDEQLDAVLITSRHDLHAATVLAALQAGKHVYVEKPLALTQKELDGIADFYAHRTASSPMLLTGFNRRFSTHMRRIASLIATRSNPMIISYRMNAGHIPLDHWVHGPEGGGRNLGEACHIYDLFTFLTGAAVESVSAKTIKPKTAFYSARDNFISTIAFADGSIATLTYSALGSKDYAKELMEIHVDGKVIVLDDYRSVEVFGSRQKGSSSRLVQKGHLEALRAFGEAIHGGLEWPAPLWQQIQATQIALDVEAQLG